MGSSSAHRVTRLRQHCRHSTTQTTDSLYTLSRRTKSLQSPTHFLSSLCCLELQRWTLPGLFPNASGRSCCQGVMPNLKCSLTSSTKDREYFGKIISGDELRGHNESVLTFYSTEMVRWQLSVCDRKGNKKDVKKMASSSNSHSRVALLKRHWSPTPIDGRQRCLSVSARQLRKSTYETIGFFSRTQYQTQRERELVY